jgi:hypothetical protein
MEDIRTYRFDDDNDWHLPDDERVEWDTKPDEEVPFHVPRD